MCVASSLAGDITASDTHGRPGRAPAVRYADESAGGVEGSRRMSEERR